MEKLFNELIQIKNKYIELCKTMSNCENCPLNKSLVTHDYGEERICDILDRI